MDKILSEMTNEELWLYLGEVIKDAQEGAHYPPFVMPDIKAEFMYRMKKKEQHDRITELEKENERQRWHYPDKGELPDENIRVLCNKKDELGDFVGVLCSYNGKWFSIGGRLTPIEDIEQWRYVD